MGKLRGWCRGEGPVPRGLVALDPDVLTADRPAHLNGITVLGTLRSPERGGSLGGGATSLGEAPLLAGHAVLVVAPSPVGFP
jgi:hypothetical protein